MFGIGGRHHRNPHIGTTAAVAAAGFVGLAAAFKGVSETLSTGFNVAAQLQTAEIGLRTLLGSADEAASTIARLKKEAARTPFELPGLTDATQLLSSVTKDGNKSVDILLNIGEALAAMGKGQAELDRIIVNLQQVGAIGHASMVDIKQFAYAGIPIFEMLEEHFKSGTTVIANNTEKLTKNGAELKKLQQQLRVAKARQDEFTSSTSDATRMATRFKIDELKTQIAALSGEMGTLQSTNGKAVQSFMSVEDAISSGQVTFELLVEMFDKANDEGGRFFGAFANQAGTFNQALSNLKDAFGIFAADFVQKSGLFQGVTNLMIDAANALGNYEKLLEDTKAAITNLFDTIDEKTGLITYLKDTWQSVVFLFDTHLKPALASLWEQLQPFKPLLDAMVQVFGYALVAAIGGLITILGGLSLVIIEGLTNLTKLAEYLLGPMLKAWKAIQSAIEGSAGAIQKFIDLAKKAMNMIGSLPASIGKSLGKALKVDDAVISPSGQLITTHPEDYLIATKDPGSLLGGAKGVTINITGTFLSEDAAEKFGDMLMSKLRLSSAF